MRKNFIFYGFQHFIFDNSGFFPYFLCHFTINGTEDFEVFNQKMSKTESPKGQNREP